MEQNKSPGRFAMNCTQNMEYEYQYLMGIGIFLTYKENVDGIHSLKGIISQAIPATIKLPKVQNAAIKLNIEPLFDLG